METANLDKLPVELQQEIYRYVLCPGILAIQHRGLGLTQRAFPALGRTVTSVLPLLRCADEFGYSAILNHFVRKYDGWSTVVGRPGRSTPTGIEAVTSIAETPPCQH